MAGGGLSGRCRKGNITGGGHIRVSLGGSHMTASIFGGADMTSQSAAVI